MTGRRKILLFVLVATVLAGIIGVSIKSQRKDATEVETAKVVKRATLIAKVQATGEIKPKEYVNLQSEIAGVITNLRVKEGDRVEKGEMLLQIDPIQTEADVKAQRALLQSSLIEANSSKSQISLQQSNVQRDEANVRLAQAEMDQAEKISGIAKGTFERKQQLFEDNLISRDDYEAARNQLITAQTSVKTATARLQQAKSQLKVSRVVLEQAQNSYKSALQRVEQSRAALTRSQDLLSKTVIRSPLTGMVTQLNVETGERAVPGTLNNPQATLMVIANMSVIEAEVQVDETDIVNVTVGQPAEIDVDALPDRPLKGTVTEVGNSAIQSSTQQQQEAKDFKVVVQLKNPPEELRPGLSCTADITTATREDVLTIPIQALTIREFPVDKNGKIIKPKPGVKTSKSSVIASTDDLEEPKRKEFQGVFVIEAGKAQFKQVTTGIIGETEIEVLSGLKQGETVISGPYKALRDLKEGDFVKVKEQSGR